MELKGYMSLNFNATYNGKPADIDPKHFLEFITIDVNGTHFTYDLKKEIQDHNMIKKIYGNEEKLND